MYESCLPLLHYLVGCCLSLDMDIKNINSQINLKNVNYEDINFIKELILNKISNM